MFFNAGCDVVSQANQFFRTRKGMKLESDKMSSRNCPRNFSKKVKNGNFKNGGLFVKYLTMQHKFSKT